MNLRAEIHYDLSYYGDSRDTQVALVDALERLPADVRTTALDRCTFTSLGQGVVGHYFPQPIRFHSNTNEPEPAQWIVVINDDLGEDDLRSVIAHEIAHIWLGHWNTTAGTWLDRERQACALVAEWGFTGLGSDPSFHEASARMMEE
jgi:hypothetical protein